MGTRVRSQRAAVLCADCTSEAGVVNLTTTGPFTFGGSFSLAHTELLSSSQ